MYRNTKEHDALNNNQLSPVKKGQRLRRYWNPAISAVTLRRAEYICMFSCFTVITAHPTLYKNGFIMYYIILGHLLIPCWPF